MSITFRFDFPKFPRKRSANYGREEGIFLKGSNGCTVLLVHGLTGTPNEMRFPAVYLNRKGYSVACPRLANHGEPLEALKYTAWQDFYATVKASFLEAKAGSSQIFVAGLSMGALLSLLLAWEFPEDISGVSCLSPTLFYDGWNSPPSRCFLPVICATFLKHFFYFKENPPYGIKNERLRQHVHKYYSQAKLEDSSKASLYGYPFFPVTLLHQLNLLIKHLDARLGDIRVPVQLIQAAADDITSMHNSRYIHDRIASKQKEIVLLFDSYHMITADQERELVSAKMEGFFTGLRSEETLVKEGLAPAW